MHFWPRQASTITVVSTQTSSEGGGGAGLLTQERTECNNSLNPICTAYLWLPQSIYQTCIEYLFNETVNESRKYFIVGSFTVKTQRSCSRDSMQGALKGCVCEYLFNVKQKLAQNPFLYASINTQPSIYNIIVHA